VISLSSGHIMKEAHQLLTDQVLVVKRQLFNSAKDDRVGEDSSVERMGGVNG
jgi:hypothetical protein